MDRHRINRISGVAPIGLSLAALGVLMVALLTGWGKGAGDEGAAAHIFQLLIVAEVPFMLAFVATADWKKAARVAGLIALQAAALLVAFAPVYYFKL